MLNALTVALVLQSPFVFQEGQIATGVVQGGRVPVARDAVAAVIARVGAFTEADSSVEWRPAKAGNDGWFTGIASGYLKTTFESTSEQIMLLDAAGHSMVYVNGTPRGGDPYGYGYLRLPVRLRQGVNTFLFGGGRGRMKAQLTPVRAPQQLEVADATLPDLIPSDHGRLFGAVVVLNNTAQPVRGLSILARVAGRSVSRRIESIPALTMRKVRFDFPVVQGAREIDLELRNGQGVVDRAKVALASKKSREAYRRTFVSEIDGSVQYYAVTPARRPSRGNALILTLHGASVEAIGQAQAYASKDWATIVAATNRRPYGFDWEDWGRMDALEVLEQAKRAFPHDPERVFLTGHSMGGHGTWHVGTLYPDRFGAIAPSAGWVSFWSYAGGWDPREPNAVERLVRTAANASDTLMRQRNLSNLGVYILHGDKDDNVPVQQARTMREALSPWHPNLRYHEQPGAGHWFGNESVDWPGIFEMFQTLRRQPRPTSFSFTTPNPGISSSAYGFAIEQLIDPREPGRLDGNGDALSTANVRKLRILEARGATVLDGQPVGKLARGEVLVRTGSRWSRGALASDEKQAARSGPFKQAFSRRMVFVYGTKGSAEENRWSYDKARFDAETWYYRGNGAVDVVSDDEFLRGGFRGRNAIFYGNAGTHGAIAKLTSPPIRLERGRLQVGDRVLSGDDKALLAVLPYGEGLCAIVGGTGLVGMRLTDRLPVFVSGVAYPDWTVLGPDAYRVGTKGILGAGYFDNAWRVARGFSAWSAP